MKSPAVRSAKSYAIFCDDVRQEANGKFILIGCYGEKMVVGNFPYAGQISALVYIPVTGEKLNLTAEFKLKSGGTLGKIEFALEVVEKVAIAQVPLPPLPFSISSADAINLNISVNASAPTTIATLRVEQGPIITPPPNLFQAA